MKRYWKYIKPYLGSFILAPLLMVTEVFGEVTLPKLMSLIINHGVAEKMYLTFYLSAASWRQWQF